MSDESNERVLEGIAKAFFAELHVGTMESEVTPAA